MAPRPTSSRWQPLDIVDCRRQQGLGCVSRKPAYGADKAIDGDPARAGRRTPASSRSAGGGPGQARDVQPGGHHENSTASAIRISPRNGATWTTLFSAPASETNSCTTCGRVTAQYVRLNILEATDGPTIREFQLLLPVKAR